MRQSSAAAATSKAAAATWRRGSRRRSSGGSRGSGRGSTTAGRSSDCATVAPATALVTWPPAAAAAPRTAAGGSSRVAAARRSRGGRQPLRRPRSRRLGCLPVSRSPGGTSAPLSLPRVLLARPMPAVPRPVLGPSPVLAHSSSAAAAASGRSSARHRRGPRLLIPRSCGCSWLGRCRLVWRSRLRTRRRWRRLRALRCLPGLLLELITILFLVRGLGALLWPSPRFVRLLLGVAAAPITPLGGAIGSSTFLVMRLATGCRLIACRHGRIAAAFRACSLRCRLRCRLRRRLRRRRWRRSHRRPHCRRPDWRPRRPQDHRRPAG